MAKFVNPTKVITGPDTRWSYCNAGKQRRLTAVHRSFRYLSSFQSRIPRRSLRSRQRFRRHMRKVLLSSRAAASSFRHSRQSKTPLRDGDLERPDDEAYANSYFINANSASAPGIVDAYRQPIIDHSEVYSGVYGRASINFYAFNSNGNKGIACGLNNLQKIRDGEPLGGKSRAEDDFDDEDDDFLD